MNTERVAIYVRVSTQEQATEGYSIDEQIDRLRKYCEAHDWKLVKEYADGGFSGAKLERPSIQQLIKDVEEHKISRVLVYKLDRLSRSQKDTLYLIEDVFEKNGVSFVSMTENFDTSTPFGKAMIGILSVFAQLEREQIKERMMMGKVGRAKEGKWIGTIKVPIGYRYIDGELVVDPYEAEIIKTIFNRYASGDGVMAISNYLAKRGMKSSYGSISKQTIYFILHNTVYIGKVTFSGVDYDGNHEAIIDQDLFYKCQARFEKNRNNPRFAVNMNNFSARNMFTGLFYCTCGAKMRVFYGQKRKDGTRLKYYGCDSRSTKAKPCLTNSKFVRADKVEKQLLEEIRKLKLNPEVFIEEIQRLRAEREKETIDPEIEPIRMRIDEIEKQIEKLIRLYTVKDIDFDIVSRQISELSTEKTKLEQTLKEKTESPERETQSVTVDETIELLAGLDLEDLTLDKVLSAQDEARVNEILRILIDKIVLSSDTIEIHWNF